jgi:hypothetical protein
MSSERSSRKFSMIRMVVVFKEKELKSDKARGFCKLTYNMRLASSNREKSWRSRYIFLY